ncbi:MAG: OmpA family protein [Acidobacteriota bacterium]|jgi:outer membrane protein OmpA-like peptidoglycan-associated protein
MSDDLTYTASDPPPDAGGTPPPENRTRLVVLVAIVFVLFGGLGFLGHRILKRLDAVDRHLAGLSTRADDAATLSEEALKRAVAAEASARAAAEGRLLAEAESAEAREDAEAARDETDAARHQANTALHAAAEARAEAERIRKEADAELNRLEQALGQVAETRRTALGLVMNLGSDYLKFEFDKAELRPSDRELLSRIAGILLTSSDYTVSVNGHTDDVGTVEYNQKLSERRAEAVRDYLVEAGVPEGILSVTGHGKSRPLVPGTSEQARARNRRVELGIVNTRVLYGREAKTNR